MADDGSKQSANTWPLVIFSYVLKVGDMEISFQEVSGLSEDSQVIEYRKAQSKFAAIKMPGIAKHGNVSLKKGICKNSDLLWEFYKQMTMIKVEKATATISLLDEGQNPLMTWTLTNAFPVKINVIDMKSESKEVAIDTIELAFESMSISQTI